MNMALLIAGPALLLAILAWALDRFMPVPAPTLQERQAAPESESKKEPVRRSPRISTDFDLSVSIESDLRNISAVVEPRTLEEVIASMNTKRSRSMDVDHYPDPHVHRFDYRDSLELQDSKIIFRKDGPLTVEPRSR